MKFSPGFKLWWLALPAVAIDRLCKIIALDALAPHGVKNAIPGVLSWTFVQNRGAAFGIMAGNILLPLMTAVLIACLLWYLLRHPEIPYLMRAGMWLIVGGGLGNLYDRIAYGYVIDFIRLDFVNFPVFNPADIFVCLGAGLVILSVLISEGRKADG